MEIRTLQYFLAVAREQNMTGAANMLHITQPTLSRQMADLERRERELTRQIQGAGGDSSYVAKERETVKVGEGFNEANRIAQEFARQQAVAAARARLEELEKARQQAERDYNKNVRDGFIQNVRTDVGDIPGQLKKAAKSGLRTIGTVVHDVGKVLADKESWKEAISETIKDLAGSPLRSAYMRSVIDVQAPSAASRKSYGARPASSPPASTGSSALSSWRPLRTVCW